jgi:peptidoglycan hydrolase-like protein with peptidoglycan-binding domain
MALLKKGDTGQAVKDLQLLLQELDYNVPITGIYDTATYNAVLNFQARHLDIQGNPLGMDGKTGDLTMWALRNPRPKAATGAIDYSVMPDISLGGTEIGRAALRIAIDELKAGAGEVGGNNMGPWVKKYLAPTGLAEGNSWCAAFVSWCFLQAAGGNKANMPFSYSAGARNVFNQFKTKGWIIDNSLDIPKPGDIVVWWRVSLPSGYGHIGIVHHFADGFVYTIEGNKASSVAGFSYVKTSMDKFLGFGRVKI